MNGIKKRMQLTFMEKSGLFPDGRIAFLADGRIVFPELRFHPEVGTEYDVDVSFRERGGLSAIGIAYPANPGKLPDSEYDRNPQIIIAVTFTRARPNSALTARHPDTGAYITASESSATKIKIGTQCWVALVQSGTSLQAYFVQNVANAAEAKPKTTSKTLVTREPGFAASVEQSFAEQGMGKAPLYEFQGEKKFPWEILGIKRTAGVDDIHKAYRKISQPLHPDNAKDSYDHESFVALAMAEDWMTKHKEWTNAVAVALNETVESRAKEVVAPAPPAPTPNTKTEAPTPVVFDPKEEFTLPCPECQAEIEVTGQHYRDALTVPCPACKSDGGQAGPLINRHTLVTAQGAMTKLRIEFTNASKMANGGFETVGQVADIEGEEMERKLQNAAGFKNITQTRRVINEAKSITT